MLSLFSIQNSLLEGISLPSSLSRRLCSLTALRRPPSSFSLWQPCSYMDDHFASIISECIIRPEAEETLRRAPVIGVPCFFSGIRSLDGQSLSAAPNTNTLLEIRRSPNSPSNPLDEEGLRDIPAACKGPSSLPPPRLRLDDFTTLINYFSQNSDRSLGRQDILEIAKSKGLSFPPPKWWRPGGYEKVP